MSNKSKTEASKYKIGVAFGRFQPFHNGHLEYILTAYEKSEYLLVGISNPDPSTIKFHPDSAHRSSSFSNPFTFFERFLMVRDTLLNLGIDRNTFDIVPLAINCPELIEYYVPKDATILLSIYEKWGHSKKMIFEELGFWVENIFNKTEKDKLVIGRDLRQKIIHDNKWNHLVPKPVYELMASQNLANRLKDIHNTERIRLDCVRNEPQSEPFVGQARRPG